LRSNSVNLRNKGTRDGITIGADKRSSGGDHIVEETPRIWRKEGGGISLPYHCSVTQGQPWEWRTGGQETKEVIKGRRTIVFFRISLATGARGCLLGKRKKDPGREKGATARREGRSLEGKKHPKEGLVGILV